MWEYKNEICRHRTDIVSTISINSIVEKELGSYIGLEIHSLGTHIMKLPIVKLLIL